LPYCKGCSHTPIAKNTAKALEACGFRPLDVISVSDIGCHGIIDKCLNTHTVHGLHGRATALAAGVSMGLARPEKKVIVFIGDGGATIGLQHILEAARLNLDMTVLVHNNMLYGMTGGQTSGLTPEGFCTTTSAEGNPYAPYDICALALSAGATFVARVMGNTDTSADLVEAFRTKGFSLVELMEICPSYGVSRNPGRKLSTIIEEAGRPLGRWHRPPRQGLPEQAEKCTDLLASLEAVPPRFSHAISHQIALILSGSAGEGVQLASTVLARAAMASGCHVTQKGSYPVTVGVGFSTAEINLSPRFIHFHGILDPDYVIISSQDGLDHNLARIQSMQRGVLFIDTSLPVPDTEMEIVRHDFRGIGARNASLFAVFFFAHHTGLLDTGALFAALGQGKAAAKLPVDKIREALDRL